MAHRCSVLKPAVCLALTVLAMACVARAQDYNSQATVSPTTLQESSATKLSVPKFSFADPPQCDDDGDVFFHLYSGSWRATSIFELTQDANKSLVYKLPADLAKAVAFEGFAVSPSGELHVLGQIREGSKDSDAHEYVFTFSDSDGSMTDKVKLDTPPYLLADAFTVLGGGATLFSGHFLEGASTGQRYTALFDASGRLSRVLNTLGKVSEGAFLGTAATVGKDGYAYLVHDSEVLEISPGGDTARHVPFINPDPGSSPVGLKVSGGLISVTLSKVGKDHMIQSSYLVLDAAIGDVRSYYVPAKELGNVMVCFSQVRGYSFLHRTSDGNALEIITAALR